MPKHTFSVTTLLQVAQWLRQHGCVSADELAEHFQLPADSIDTLVQQLGDTYFERDLPWTKLEVDWVAYDEQRRVCLIQDHGITDLQQLTADDAFALTVALWFLVSSGVLSDPTVALRLADRLIAAFELGPMWNCFHYVSSADPAPVRAAALATIDSGEALQITYVALSGQRSTRTVIVESVELSDGNWIVSGFCAATAQRRHFRCDRISDWKPVPIPAVAATAWEELRRREAAVTPKRYQRKKQRLVVDINPRWRWALTNVVAPRKGQWVIAVEDEYWAENQLLRLGEGLRACSDERLLQGAANRAAAALANYHELGLV